MVHGLQRHARAWQIASRAVPSLRLSVSSHRNETGASWGPTGGAVRESPLATGRAEHSDIPMPIATDMALSIGWAWGPASDGISYPLGALTIAWGASSVNRRETRPTCPRR